MPKVKQAAFRCPSCGATTSVKRTRADSRGRLMRYRVCAGEAAHRITTRELLTSEANPPPMRLALKQCLEFGGMSMDQSGPSATKPEN